MAQQQKETGPQYLQCLDIQFGLNFAPKISQKNNALPSQVHVQKGGARWLTAINNLDQAQRENKLIAGRWIIEGLSSPQADNIWPKLVKEIRAGRLWQAKISAKNDAYETHTLLVQTIDSTDPRQTLELYKKLQALKIIPELADDEEEIDGAYSDVSRIRFCAESTVGKSNQEESILYQQTPASIKKLIAESGKANDASENEEDEDKKNSQPIFDYLPLPDVLDDELFKLRIALAKKSVSFGKDEAKRRLFTQNTVAPIETELYALLNQCEGCGLFGKNPHPIKNDLGSLLAEGSVLSGLDENGPCILSVDDKKALIKAINKFETNTRKLPNAWIKWGAILGTIVATCVGMVGGAVAGAAIGGALGSVTGPGALATATLGAIAGGSAGAMGGVAIGGTVGLAAAGVVGSVFNRHRLSFWWNNRAIDKSLGNIAQSLRQQVKNVSTEKIERVPTDINFT